VILPLGPFRMFPYVDLGSLHLSVYALLNGLAAVIGATVLFLRWTAGGMSPVTARWTVMAGFAGGVAGAFSIGNAITAFGSPGHHGPLVTSELGLLLGGGTAVILSLRRAGLPVGPAADRAAVAVTLAQAISRMGCVAAGCCFGNPSAGPLAFSLPDVRGHVCPRYPTQAAMVTFHLIMIPLLVAVERRWKGHPGATASLYVLAFALVRFFMEPFRGDAAVVWLGLTGTQLLAVPFALGAAITLVRTLRTGG